MTCRGGGEMTLEEELDYIASMIVLVDEGRVVIGGKEEGEFVPFPEQRKAVRDWAQGDRPMLNAEVFFKLGDTETPGDLTF